MASVPVCTVRTRSAEETARFGAAIGDRVAQGACICVTGPLGAGKTVLVGGLCRGLGARDAVVSPTFILLERLQGRLPIAHVDLYRLEHERELEEIGVFDLLSDEVVLVAEWGDRSPTLAEAADVRIAIEPADGDERTIVVTATPGWAAALGELRW